MKILVGICGSIASYRSPDFIKELVKAGHEVRAVLSPNAHEFVSEKVLETMNGQKVFGPASFGSDKTGTDHISVARWAELVFIYGASADALSRMAAGAAGDFLSLQMLAFTGPVIIAAAMNPAMWMHPAVKRNVELVKAYGYRFVGPDAGVVACGEEGVGHIATHEAMFAAIRDVNAEGRTLKSNSLSGCRVLISAGAMRTAIDPMRFIQNRSSGESALHLARALKAHGAEVELLIGTIDSRFESIFISEFSDFKRFVTIADYEQHLSALFKNCDLFVSLAAVLDFSASEKTKKLSREELGQTLEIQIQPVADFVKGLVSTKRSDQRVVAFAAEVGTEAEILARAQAKLVAKGADLIVANPLGNGLGAESAENRYWILKPGEKAPIRVVAQANKAVLAAALADELETLMNFTQPANADLMA